VLSPWSGSDLRFCLHNICIVQEEFSYDYDSSIASTLVFAATYNEVGNIENWVTSVARYLPGADMLVIDDNSPDGTAEVLHKLQNL
jgi:hypothetical protein